MSRRPLFVVAFCFAVTMVSIIAPRIHRAAPLQGTEASGTIYFPQVADTGGYTTSFIFINNSPDTTNILLRAISPSGQPLNLTMK